MESASITDPSLVDPSKIVARADLESLLAAIDRDVTNPDAGIFGPDSITWRINREAALFLGAGRAALLQLAHPWVAVALNQHSSLLSKPITRFHNTFRIVFTTIFGSTPQVLAAARSLHQLHTRIRGRIPAPVASYSQGSRYEANYLPALRWVYATLVQSAVLAYEFVLPPLTSGQREAYYAESKSLAALFGIPAEALPANWTSFMTYIAEMCDSSALGIDAQARVMAHALLSGSGSRVHLPHWYRALTTQCLPPRFRNEFDLSFGPAEERAVLLARRRLPRIYSRLPKSIRFVGPYHQALARLAQRQPGLLTRASNRFWIGQPLLPFDS